MADATRAGGPRAAFGSFVELFALAGLAITQPILDVFGRAPEFFVFRDATGPDLVAFAVVVAVVPALVLWALTQLVGVVSPRLRDGLHAASIGLLLVVLALGWSKQTGAAAGAAAVGLSLALATGGVLAYRRWRGLGLWLRYLGVAPVAFVALFLTASQTSDLLSSQTVSSARIGVVGNPAPVVFLQLDEWPLQTVVDEQGRIDRQLYPNLAALAADGTWYRNTTTAANFTTYAVPAILTGRRPDADLTAIASEYPENLFTLLGGAYDLDVIESVTRLCPDNLCDGRLVDQGGTSATAAGSDAGRDSTLRLLLTDARLTFRAMISPDPEATSPAEDFERQFGETDLALDDGSLQGLPQLSLQDVNQLIASIEPGERPTLHFLHMLLPHTPYQFFPDGRRYLGGPGVAAEGAAQERGRGDDPDELRFIEQRLIAQAGYTDRLIGRVMDRLREVGLYDDAVIVVTADHGIGLEPGGVTRTPRGADGLGPENYADLYYVPLVIKSPGLGDPGLVVDAPTRTTDILPTIAAALEIDLPWEVDGIDLGADGRADPWVDVGLVTGGFAEGPLTLSDEIRFDSEAVLSDVLERNTSSLLLSDDPSTRLFAITEGGDLIGHRLRDEEVGAHSELSAIIRRADAFDDVDLATGILPAHLEVDLGGDVPVDPLFAVVLNGRVAAVTSTWSTEIMAHHTEVLLAPDHFEDGRNTVDLYLVEGPEGARRYRPVTISD